MLISFLMKHYSSIKWSLVMALVGGIEVLGEKVLSLKLGKMTRVLKNASFATSVSDFLPSNLF